MGEKPYSWQHFFDDDPFGLSQVAGFDESSLEPRTGEKQQRRREPGDHEDPFGFWHADLIDCLASHELPFALARPSTYPAMRDADFAERDRRTAQYMRARAYNLDCGLDGITTFSTGWCQPRPGRRGIPWVVKPDADPPVLDEVPDD